MQQCAELDVCDGTLYYERDIEKPGMPVLVFLHGAACNHTVFTKLRRHFRERGFGAIAVDLRGEGKSHCRHESYDLDSHVRDIERILDKEGIGRAVFVGYCMGACVSFAFAAEHPQRVRAIVAISASYDFVKSFSRSTARREFLKRTQALRDVSIFINKSLRPLRKVDEFYPDLSHDKYRNFHLFLADCFIGPYREDYELLQRRRFKILDWNLEPRLPRVEAPVCLIHGELDMLIPVETTYELAKMLPRAQIPVVVKGKTHNLVLEAPEQIMDAMEAFFKRVYSA